MIIIVCPKCNKNDRDVEHISSTHIDNFIKYEDNEDNIDLFRCKNCQYEFVVKNLIWDEINEVPK